MMHELKHIVSAYKKAKEMNLKSVLATVVDLDGSSYRKPGVRMLIIENGNMIGAVSGGCVEKEVLRQAQSVFLDGRPKMMTYDGRYRLGCEGVIYILIEKFTPKDEFIIKFDTALINREPLKIKSKYIKEEGVYKDIGSFVAMGGNKFSLSGLMDIAKPQNLYIQELRPCFKLIIFGAEHDAVQLCKLAFATGWEVEVVSGISEPKTIENFPGASSCVSSTAETYDFTSIDSETAIMVMTHSFSNDLKWLLALKDYNPAYLGLLGPVKKRESLISQLLEYDPNISEKFIDSIHGPAGLNIGSITSQEIAISIIAEILSVIRNQTPVSLKEKTGNIHV
ncbi:MAG: XshC-Cox1-family protein [Flavobacteriaceae bacterium]|nr:XshC-Cox1-family protein [Flavobacteriaceae bacterium]